MAETTDELVERITKLKEEAQEAAMSGNHAGTEARRDKARELENKLRAWRRGEPWTGGGD